MLYFFCPPPGVDRHALAHRGLAPAGGVRLFAQLSDAWQAAGAGPVLVVDGAALSPTPPAAESSPDGPVVHVPTVPPAALCNAHPYRPPVPIAAGGGYVAANQHGTLALLVIFRRGVWDLPKGKQDPGETVAACAAREVREEVGLETLELLRPLGTTQHGYVRGRRYEVKTTHWFLMQTPERAFAPQRGEGIRRVACARWTVARRHLGYATLRRHMEACAADVHAAFGLSAPAA